MQSGQVVFTGMDRVIFGQAAAGAVAGKPNGWAPNGYFCWSAAP